MRALASVCMLASARALAFVLALTCVRAGVTQSPWFNISEDWVIYTRVEGKISLAQDHCRPG